MITPHPFLTTNLLLEILESGCLLVDGSIVSQYGTACQAFLSLNKGQFEKYYAGAFMAGDVLAKNGGVYSGKKAIDVVYSVVFECSGPEVKFEVFGIKGKRAPEDVVADLAGATCRLKREWKIDDFSEEGAREPHYSALAGDQEGKTT